MAINQKQSYSEYTVSTPQGDFAIGFEDYNEGEKDRINVTVDGEDATSKGYTVLRKNALTIAMEPFVPSGIVRLTRETNIDNTFYKFTAGAIFDAANVDANFLQVLHSQQEVRDRQTYVEGRVLPLVNGLEEALAAADAASHAAQEAAAAAEEAAGQVTNKAEQFFEGDVLTPIGEWVDIKGYKDRLGNAYPLLNESMTNIVKRLNYLKGREVTPYDFGAIGDGTAHPLSERYSTLAAAQAVYPKATALTEYIDGHAIQKWFEYICTNATKLATICGKFVINTRITNAGLNTLFNPIKTKHIFWNADIKAVGITGTVWQIISFRQTVFTGFVNAYDAGGAVYSSRTADTFFYLEDFISASMFWRVIIDGCRYAGLIAYSGAAGTTVSGQVANNNSSRLGDIQIKNCGHRFSFTTFNFNGRVDSGSLDSSNQRTTLTLTAAHTLPRTNLAGGAVRISGNYYAIASSTATTIDIYPQIADTAVTSGTLQISFGGDYRLEGPDSNNIQISGASSNCAICGGDQGFYTGHVHQRTNEFNDIGLYIGNGIAAEQIAPTYSGFYYEGNELDVFKVSITSESVVFINPVNLTLSKIRVLVPLGTGRTPSLTVGGGGIRVDYGTGTLRRRKLQNYTGTTPITNTILTIGDDACVSRTNNATITLRDNADIRNTFGIVDVEIEVFGTAANNGTSSTTTIARDAGFTINGAAANMTIAASAAPFIIRARLVNGTDWRVRKYTAS